MQPARLFSSALLLAMLALPAYAVDMPPDEGGGEEMETPVETPAPAPAPGKAAPKAAADDKPKNDFTSVLLRGLNKVTGQTSKFSAPIGDIEHFGTLEIIAHRCWQASPEDRPENAALLEIREMKGEGGPSTLFTGWMFSSSPGLSALENPVYDITVLACEAGKAEAKAPAPKPMR